MRRSALYSRWVLSTAAGLLPLPEVVAQPAPQRSAGVFTADQAQSGRAVYDRNCSACHGMNFEGTGDAPSLAGGTFMLKWRSKMVSELFGEILQTMPPTNPGSLGEAAALNVTAYILQRNGAQAGEQSLAAANVTPIGTIATGQAPAQGGGRGGGGRGGGSMVLGAGTTAGQGRGGGTPARGVRVAGEVENYVPVTPETLRKPPDEDWLIFGRNYQRHSYSPLNQIT